MRPFCWALLVGTAWGSVGAVEVLGEASSGSTRSTGSITILDSLGSAVAGSADGQGISTRMGWIPAAGGLVAPPLVSVSVSVGAGESVTGTLPGQDQDGDPLTWALLSPPSLGSVTFGAGSFQYSASPSVGGVDLLSVEAADGRGFRTRGTLSVRVIANQNVVRAFLPGVAAPYRLTVGTPVPLAILGGQPPLRYRSESATVAIGATISGVDADGDGQVDRGVAGRLEATVEGSGSVEVTDAQGTTTTITFTAVAAPAVSQPVAPPSIPTTPRTGQTLFGALGPQTSQGVASLRRVFGGLAATQAVAYAWDAPSQSFVTLPAEPTGGLTAGSGIFVAARVDLDVDFAGTPARLPYTWTLAPGWNFLAVPLLVDAEDRPVTALSPLSDLVLREAEGTELVGTDRTDVFTGNWWAYDGQNYTSAETLAPGRAYWVRNRSEPARPVVLTVSVGAGPRLARTAEGRRPPAPPTQSSSEGPAGPASGCGAGGLALLLGGLAMLGIRFRSPRA